MLYSLSLTQGFFIVCHQSLFLFVTADWFGIDCELRVWMYGVSLTFDSQGITQYLETWKRFSRYLLQQSINYFVT